MNETIYYRCWDDRYECALRLYGVCSLNVVLGGATGPNGTKHLLRIMFMQIDCNTSQIIRRHRTILHVWQNLASWDEVHWEGSGIWHICRNKQACSNYPKEKLDRNVLWKKHHCNTSRQASFFLKWISRIDISFQMWRVSCFDAVSKNCWRWRFPMVVTGFALKPTSMIFQIWNFHFFITDIHDWNQSRIRIFLFAFSFWMFFSSKKQV